MARPAKDDNCAHGPTTVAVVLPIAYLWLAAIRMPLRITPCGVEGKLATKLKGDPAS